VCGDGPVEGVGFVAGAVVGDQPGDTVDAVGCEPGAGAGPESCHGECFLIGVQGDQLGLQASQKTHITPGIRTATSQTPKTPSHTATGADEPACKPGSVTANSRRSSICERRCRRPPPAASATGARPTRRLGRAALEHLRGCRGILLGLAPGGVCPAIAVTCDAVVSCTTVSPLPDHSGGLFSVALSRGSPRVDVVHHPALWSPDFPRRRDAATVRPTRPWTA